MKKYSTRLTIYLCLVAIFSTSIPVNVFALEESDFIANDITLYSRLADSCVDGTATGTGASSGVSKVVKSETLQKIFVLLINGGLNNVQAAAVMGNMYWESKFNSDAHEGGNDIGYGLVQWSFGRRTNLTKFAATKGVPTSDIAMQIEFLFQEYNSYYKDRLVGTAFVNATDVGKATEAWMMKFEVPGMKPANDPARLNSQRIPAAIAVYEFYKDLIPVVSLAPQPTVTTTNCSTTDAGSNGVVAGNIVDTAIGLALTSPIANGNTRKTDARDTYQTTKVAINPGPQWSDCGGFVSTVMRASGVDTNYPSVSVAGAQMPYVKSHPEKYQILTPKSIGDLQPGDILLTSSHTSIYSGKVPNAVVDASLGQRVPSVRPSASAQWMINNGAIVARVIK